MDRSPSGTSFVGRAFGSYIGARVHELYCTCTEAVRDSAGDAAPCAKLEKRVNAGALQSAGLGLQRSCTVMQLRERRLFSMQLVLRVCSCVPRSTDVTTSAGFRAAGRPARNPAMPGGDARIQIKCDVENENPRFDCFN